MIRMVGVVLVLMLAACVSTQANDYGEWVKSGRARAEQGELKWSDYYQGCFSRLSASTNEVKGKAAQLEHYHLMISYALEFEKGKLSKPEFEEKVRLAEIARVRSNEARQSARADAVPQTQTTY